MEVINAMMDVVNTLPLDGMLTPTSINEPEADCSLVITVMNSSLVQTIWGWSKAVPGIVKYVVFPVLCVMLLLFVIGMMRAGKKLVGWILMVILVAALIALVPALLNEAGVFLTTC